MNKTYSLHLGDCLDSLRAMPDCSVDSIVTDPPYGLTANKKGGTGAASIDLESPYGRARIGVGNGPGGFMGMKWDSDVPPVEVWAECLRVLKPGGHLLAFAGTRTQHRMAVRIEDAGFEIRDMIAWVYGSGFPKSLDVSKAIDKAAGAEREFQPVGNAVKRMIPGADQNATGSWIKDSGREYQPGVSMPATEAACQWAGWGTALKPALEPITVARKPLIGTVAANVLEHGTGAMNIDGCRVETDDLLQMGKTGLASEKFFTKGAAPEIEKRQHDAGRWPANLIHDGSEEVLAAFPRAPGQLAKASTSNTQRAGQNTYGVMARGSNGQGPRGDAGSAARFFYCAKASRADRNEGLTDPGPQFKHGATLRQVENTETRGNHHPTVKPTDLMAYLVRLVTPPGGVVLDPFMGSGSTGKAAVREGFRFIGCEMNPEYLAIAEARIAHELDKAEAARDASISSTPQLDLFAGA